MRAELERLANSLSRAVLVILLAANTSFAWASSLDIFLAPYGDDHATGLARSTPVRSLQAAIRVALANETESLDQIRIRVAAGRYSGQRAIIQGRRTSKPLVIAPDRNASARPRFDGANRGGTWLVVKSATGQPSRIIVEGLEITNYVTVISFNGNREKISASNGENIVRDNVFKNIGQIAFPSGPASTAAVRLVNSDDNKIIRNRFENIRNVKGCGALHAIYIAHDSTRNLVTNNVFDGGCGATIKVRDGSSGNRVLENDFSRQEAPVFEDSYCDRNTRQDCTKKSNECPSWANEFRNNTVKMAAGKRVERSVVVRGDSSPVGCAKPEPEAHRTVEENNVFE